MEPPYKSNEISYECCYLLLKLIKNISKIVFDPERTFGLVKKILANLAVNRMHFVEKFNKGSISWIFSIRQGKGRIYLQNFARLEEKSRHFWKFLRKFWDLLITSLWKIDFFIIFDQMFLGFLLLLKNRYIPMEDNTSFLQQFFGFRGGGISMVPPLPDASAFVIHLRLF